MKNEQQHPSALLQADWVITIRQHAAAAEAMGKLHNEQLKLIYEQGWFKFLVPAIYGGLELALPQQVRLEESLSWANGSLGWVVTLCSGAGWFGGFLDAGVAHTIFADPTACLAGSGAATGTATITDGGYIINGEWKYASGVHHATQVTANCIIKKGNEIVLNDDGSPLVLPFVFNRDDGTLFSAWKYVGMMATGSDGYRVNDLFVPANRSFKIAPDAAVVHSPLYKYPFMQLAEATLTANLSGMAFHYIDLCEAIVKEKLDGDRLTPAQKQELDDCFNHHTGRFNDARLDFYSAVDASWQQHTTNNEADETLLNEVSKSSRILARTARTCVDALYPYCGLMAANPDTEINQVWRDFHTAGQHNLLIYAL